MLALGLQKTRLNNPPCMNHWNKFMFFPLQSLKIALIVSLPHSWNECDHIWKKKKKKHLLICSPGCSLYAKLCCIPYSLIFPDIKLWRKSIVIRWFWNREKWKNDNKCAAKCPSLSYWLQIINTLMFHLE